jgi:hypothetical protein
MVAGIGAAYVGGRFADASARRAADVQLIGLAINILEQPPPHPSRELRTWAVGVLEKHGDINLPERAKLALADSVALPIPLYATWTTAERGIYAQPPWTERLPPESAWIRLLDSAAQRRIDSARKARPRP